MTCQLICIPFFKNSSAPPTPCQSFEAKCQVLCSQSLSIIFLIIPMRAIHSVLMAGAYQCTIWQPPVSALSPSPPGNEAPYCSQDTNIPQTDINPCLFPNFWLPHIKEVHQKFNRRELGNIIEPYDRDMGHCSLIYFTSINRDLTLCQELF